MDSDVLRLVALLPLAFDSNPGCRSPSSSFPHQPRAHQVQRVGYGGAGEVWRTSGWILVSVESLLFAVVTAAVTLVSPGPSCILDCRVV